MNKWTEKDVDITIELLKNGKSYDEISKIIKKPSSSIRSKLFKIGLKSRDYFFIEKECLFCKKLYKTTRKNKRKFCNHSCSSKYSNKKRGNFIYKETECLNCNKIIHGKKKYCSNKCQGDNKRKIIFEKIKNGDVSFNEKCYKKYLIEKHGEECMECGLNKINITTGKIPIQLEHIDGHSENNSLNNLKLLCPNCHSLTPTYGALNKGNGRKNRYKIRSISSAG